MRLQYGDDSLARRPEPPSAERQLRTALDAAVSSRVFDTSALERTVREFTVQLRLGGAPPEKAIACLKSLVAEHATPLAYGDRAELVDWVVHWAIDAYYRLE